VKNRSLKQHLLAQPTWTKKAYVYAYVCVYVCVCVCVRARVCVCVLLAP